MRNEFLECLLKQAKKSHISLSHFIKCFNFALDLFSRPSAKSSHQIISADWLKFPKSSFKKWKPESKHCRSQNRQNRNFLSIQSHLPFVSYVSFCWQHMIQFWLHWWHRPLCIKKGSVDESCVLGWPADSNSVWSVQWLIPQDGRCFGDNFVLTALRRADVTLCRGF